MIIYDYELDNLVKTSNFVPYKVKRKSRYEVGKYYWCGYWKKYYKVLDVEYSTSGYLLNVTVQWQDGRTSTHKTPLDPRYDYELREAFLDADCKVVNSKISYRGAEIKALCCLGAIPEEIAEILMTEYYNSAFAPSDEVYYFVGFFHSAFLKRDLLKSERAVVRGPQVA